MSAMNVKSLMRKAVLRFSIRSRKRKAEVIGAFLDEHNLTTSIFIGCSPGTNENEGIVESAVAERTNVTAASDVVRPSHG